MTKPEILELNPTPIPEVKAILKKVHERDGELSFRGGKTEDYVNEVAGLSVTKTKELHKKIEKLEVPRLKEKHIVKITDTLPENAEHLKVILSGYNVTVTKENLKRISDTLDDYRPVKK